MPNPCVFSRNYRDIAKSFRISTLGTCFVDLHILSFRLVHHSDGRRITALDTSHLNGLIASFIPTLRTGESARGFLHVGPAFFTEPQASTPACLALISQILIERPEENPEGPYLVKVLVT
ncbi:MAG: hypothetical protein ABSG74_08950 [Candidatus Bathyarchaeia archaeon]